MLNNIKENMSFWGKVIPIFIMLSGITFYWMNRSNPNFAHQWILTSTIMMLITIWAWAVYAIAKIADVIDESVKDIKDVITEVKLMKKEINDLKNTSNR